MLKSKNKKALAEQAARFQAEVERFAAAGELNPTEAGKCFQETLGTSILKAAKPTRS